MKILFSLDSGVSACTRWTWYGVSAHEAFSKQD